MKKIILGLAMVVAGTALAAAQPVRLTVGTAGQNGTVQLRLVGSDLSQLDVQVAVSAGDSGYAIAKKIKDSVRGSLSPLAQLSWSAQISWSAQMSATVTFSHFDGESWSDVNDIEEVTDTASASLMLSSSDIATAVEVEVDRNTVASGRDAKGGPSYLTFSIVGIDSPYTLLPQPGQTPKSVLDGICSYLDSTRAEGLQYSRDSDTKIRIVVRYRNSYVWFQTNDSGLQGSVKLLDQFLPIHSGLIDR